MTEIDKLKRAKMYLEQLANGTDPITGDDLSNDTVLNNVRLSRCFFYVANILQKVIDNGGEVIKKPNKDKLPFEITEEQKNLITYSDYPILITQVCNNISSVVDVTIYQKLQPLKVNNWLVKLGYLSEIETPNGTRKIITDTSALIGITQEERVSSNGSPYTANLYSKEAQKFIVDHLDEILYGDYDGGPDVKKHP